MANNILRNYGAAREGSYFKVEQEAEIQKHRQKLIKEGKLDPSALKEQRRQAGFQDSEQTYEVLSEVLQQAARVDDPQAARRKEFERRVKGEAEPLSAEDALRYGSRQYALAAAVGHVPAMSFGRGRYAVPVPEQGGGGLALAPRQLSPEAAEAARRMYSSGVRALLYGSLLAAIGIAAAGTYAARSLGIRSGEDFQRRAQALSQPLSEGLRAWVGPLKATAHAWLGGPREPGSGDGGTAEFQRRLAQRYNPPRSGVAPPT